MHCPRLVHVSSAKSYERLLALYKYCDFIIYYFWLLVCVLACAYTLSLEGKRQWECHATTHPHIHTDRKSSSTWTDTTQTEQSDNRTTAILLFPPPKHTFKCEVISHYHPEVASFARGSTAPEEAFIRLWKPHNLLSWRHRRHCQLHVLARHRSETFHH